MTVEQNKDVYRPCAWCGMTHTYREYENGGHYTCNCDADENGLYLCLRHFSHPMEDGVMVCAKATVQMHRPDLKASIIDDLLADQWTYQAIIDGEWEP